MTIYFKTKKDSETGKKIQALVDRAKNAEEEINKFVDELKSDRKYLTSDRYILGTGIVGLKFEIEPDMKVWKKFHGFPFYYSPRMSSKEGKQLQEKLNSFDKVCRTEIGETIGFDDFLKTPGIELNGVDYFGIAFGSDWNHSLPTDCVEITGSEYNNLKNVNL
ncbi:hypothetical protein L0B70_00325 [Kaistella sp. 97-N-M2]|uniref:hypothetical protein n=1 Tax=Kaistella sp. 97-N-M2 TaxID=2908645 RepID=UPI001F2EE486|nr:hypothetical protein [Kaistella sp. 97-N-M2]UJF29873.1 hypothetical protein L0B70_00325 [Kaistella sp. 97-N-M2]